MEKKRFELQSIDFQDYVIEIHQDGHYEVFRKEYDGELSSVLDGDSGRDLAEYFAQWADIDLGEVFEKLVHGDKKIASEFKEFQKLIEEERRLPGCYLGEFEILSGSGYWRSQYSIEGNPDGSFTIYGLCLEPGHVDRHEWVIHGAKELVSYGEERGMDLETVYKRLVEHGEPLAEDLIAELQELYPDGYSDYKLKMTNRPLEGQLELPFIFKDSKDISDIDRLRDNGQEATRVSEIPVQGQLLTEIFPTKWVAGLMQRARKVFTTTSEPPQGWTKMRVDLNRFLAVFKSLRIKEGRVLRAYQWCSGGNGYGVVCALPQDLPFPEPEECEITPSDYPKEFVLVPQGALNDPMEAIEGDLSLWSYMEASIFARELGEIGAMWHGINWWTHKLLDRDDFSKPSPPKDILSPDLYAPPDLFVHNWDWLKPQPEDWRPIVKQEGDLVTVVFYTYSGHGRHRIYRHEDEYEVGSYCFDTMRIEIAERGGGFLF
jgi:hypothetical protein